MNGSHVTCSHLIGNYWENSQDWTTSAEDTEQIPGTCNNSRNHQRSVLVRKRQKVLQCFKRSHCPGVTTLLKRRGWARTFLTRPDASPTSAALHGSGREGKTLLFLFLGWLSWMCPGTTEIIADFRWDWPPGEKRNPFSRALITRFSGTQEQSPPFPGWGPVTLASSVKRFFHLFKWGKHIFPQAYMLHQECWGNYFWFLLF